MANTKFRTGTICPNCRVHTVQLKKKIAKYSEPMWVCKECSIIVLDEAEIKRKEAIKIRQDWA